MVNVTGSIVLSSSFMLLSVAVMPLVHEVPNDAAGLIACCPVVPPPVVPPVCPVSGPVLGPVVGPQLAVNVSLPSCCPPEVAVTVFVVPLATGTVNVVLH